MSFALYLCGFVLVIGGMVYGAALAHVPTHFIVMATAVMLGIGIVTGVKATRQRD